MNYFIGRVVDTQSEERLVHLGGVGKEATFRHDPAGHTVILDTGAVFWVEKLPEEPITDLEAYVVLRKRKP